MHHTPPHIACTWGKVTGCLCCWLKWRPAYAPPLPCSPQASITLADDADHLGRASLDGTDGDAALAAATAREEAEAAAAASASLAPGAPAAADTAGAWAGDHGGASSAASGGCGSVVGDGWGEDWSWAAEEDAAAGWGAGSLLSFEQELAAVAEDVVREMGLYFPDVSRCSCLRACPLPLAGGRALGRTCAACRHRLTISRPGHLLVPLSPRDPSLAWA